MSAAAVLFLLQSACVLHAAGGKEGFSPPSAGTRGIFLAKCSRCHEPERAYAVLDDWTDWVMTVARMAVKDRSWIPPGDVKRIVTYHSEYRDSQNALFEERCGGCHGWRELRDLEKSRTQWRTWVRFMAQRHSAGITMEECELLLLGLAGETGDGRLGGRLTATTEGL